MAATRIVLALALLSLALPGFAEPPACPGGHAVLQILGSRGPEFLDGAASTSYLIWIDGKARVLVDTGPGSARRFAEAGARYADLALILFTHFHVDHSADLAAYVKAGFFSDRKRDLPLFGPSGNSLVAGMDRLVQRLIGAPDGLYPYLSQYLEKAAPSPYKLRPHEIPWSYEHTEPRPVYARDGIRVSAAPVHHGPFPALAYRVEAGGCTLAFSGDMTGRLHSLPALARGADILVAHNAIPEDARGVPARLHMRPSTIGEIAAEAGVKGLVLSHFMKRSLHRQGETLDLVRRHYTGPVAFAHDLDRF